MLNLSEVLDKKLDGLARTSLAIGVLIATVARRLGQKHHSAAHLAHMGGDQLRPVRPGCDLVEGPDYSTVRRWRFAIC